MLRTVFIGSRNRFDEILVHWLAERTELAGVVWTGGSAWRRTARGRARFARERVRRRGLLKALDEAAFHVYYHRRLAARDLRRLEEAVLEPYFAEHGRVRWTGDALRPAGGLDDPAVAAFLRERAPDAVFATCISARFSDELLAIPRHGAFLWHEGITPEYRGLYSPFWALHERDPGAIGATLLRMNRELDAGDVFVQVAARDVDPRRDHHVYLGHKAIWDSLPAVERFLGELEAGTARPLRRPGAKSRYFSYPGLTDFARQRWRVRRGGAAAYYPPGPR